MKKRTKKRKKNWVSLKEMENLEDVKMLKKKNLKDCLNVINLNGLLK
mgnify:CR=1 FL=1